MFGLDNVESCKDLSRGQRKYVLLCVIMICSFPNLLLLDEPASGLDVFGLIQLRRIIEGATATVVLVSHDVDLINDVATDIITMEGQNLQYYPGNYDSYRLMKDQQGLHELRQSVAMEKKKDLPHKQRIESTKRFFVIRQGRNDRVRIPLLRDRRSNALIDRKFRQVFIPTLKSVSGFQSLFRRIRSQHRPHDFEIALREVHDVIVLEYTPRVHCTTR